MNLYKVYKVNMKTGDMKRLSDALGTNMKQAFKNWQSENGWKYRSLKGRYFVVPLKTSSKNIIKKK